MESCDNILAVQKILTVSSAYTSQVRFAICFDNFWVWLLFQQGDYNILDLKSEEVLSKGQLSSSILQAKSFDNYSIIYYDYASKQLRLLNLVTNSVIATFCPKVPTKTTLNFASQENELYTSTVAKTSQILCFP